MLEHLLVVELASVLAGPAVGQFFAELGARVVKLENARTGGDVTRKWKVKGEAPEKPDSAYYRSVNFGKEVRMLDFTLPEDREEAYALIAVADVVVSNFSASAATKLGMEEARLRALNERLVFAQLDAFPASVADRPAYDIVLQAETGFLSMTGTEAGEICRMPVALIDLLAAHQLKEGILLALLRRAATGKGARVSTNLYASALASLANQATNYLIADQLPKAMGSKHPNIAPYGDVFTTSDGHRIVLAVGTDQQFENLCQLLELEMPAHLRSNADRVAHRQEVLDLLREPLKNLALSATLLLCKSEKIPVGHIKNMAEVFQEAVASSCLLTYPDGQRIVKTVAFQID